MLKLRPARKQDINLVAKWSEKIAIHERHYNPKTFVAFKDSFCSELEAWLTQLQNSNHANIIIANHNGVDAGFSLALILKANNPFTIYPFHGVIQLLWIEQEFRRCGLARRLVEEQEAFLRQYQVPFIEIQYSHANPHAEKFWQKMGYAGALHTLRKFT